MRWHHVLLWKPRKDIFFFVKKIYSKFLCARKHMIMRMIGFKWSPNTAKLQMRVLLSGHCQIPLCSQRDYFSQFCQLWLAKGTATPSPISSKCKHGRIHLSVFVLLCPCLSFWAYQFSLKNSTTLWDLNCVISKKCSSDQTWQTSPLL